MNFVQSPLRGAPVGSFGQSLVSMLPKFVHFGCTIKGELILFCKAEHIEEVSTFLRDHTYCQYKQLADITAIDWLPEATAEEKRFEVVYNLLCVKYNCRIRIKAGVAGEGAQSTIPSVTRVFESAPWLEREVWDMFGIFFENNPDLRRILTDYGFEGHPLRKEFPLCGYVELRYDDSKKKVVGEAVEMAQEYRSFDCPVARPFA